MPKYTLAALLAVSLSIAQGQTPPDFTGTWKCNIEKSSWGTSTPPPDVTLIFRHKDPEMAVTQIVAEVTEEFRFITDGRENINNLSQGPLKSRMKWQGSVLSLESVVGDGEVTMSDRLALSPDGNTIRMTRHIKSGEGENDWVMLFEKQAAPKPNLSGTWKVIVAKSDFGGAPAPSSMVSKIDHKEPALKFYTVTVGAEGERTYDLTFATDGSETSNPVGNLVFKTKCKWEGDALLMESKASEGDLTGRDKWTLSEDVKTLTLGRVWSGSQGDVTQKLVHEKQ
jgi:hypothetical protein